MYHKYYTLNNKHNHELESFGENNKWKSHGQSDFVTKNFIRIMMKNNVSIGVICNILGVSNVNHTTPFRGYRSK
jgi:hypothetical protein